MMRVLLDNMFMFTLSSPEHLAHLRRHVQYKVCWVRS